jgi:membrane protein
MRPAAAPPPIIGVSIDPPPRPVPPAVVERLDRSTLGGIAYRAARRYSYANAGLLAAGTAYYLLLAMLSLLAFAYGVIAIVGADELAARLTDALSEAMPNLIGEDGIDPDQLRSTGQTVGVIGLVVLLYSSLGAVGGASRSIHVIYGAPPDTRAIVRAKARHLAVLVAVTPLILVSFSSSGLASTVAGPVLEAIGLHSGVVRTLLATGGVVVGFAVDVLVFWILLGRLGGIRPHRKPRLSGSLVGAACSLVVKQLLQVIVAWSLAKPQYGAFAAPLAVLFVLSLLSTVLYLSAAVAGGMSEEGEPV